jgi:predicted secreted protein
MQWTSILAIYALIWVMCAFIMLPFGVKTHEEAGLEKVAGQADSAPVQFRPVRHMARAALVAAVLCGLFYANYVHGWVSAEDLNFFGKPPMDSEPAIYRD